MAPFSQFMVLMHKTLSGYSIGIWLVNCVHHVTALWGGVCVMEVW